mmetsp:Transcript_60604/g.144410  ORF Transcript_60604/g.144410 Transcript_60604/m.144410 type:complete len:284 (+) Transcript_60604:8-859(+)
MATCFVEPGGLFEQQLSAGCSARPSAELLQVHDLREEIHHHGPKLGADVQLCPRTPRHVDAPRHPNDAVHELRHAPGQQIGVGHHCQEGEDNIVHLPVDVEPGRHVALLIGGRAHQEGPHGTGDPHRSADVGGIARAAAVALAAQRVHAGGGDAPGGLPPRHDPRGVHAVELRAPGDEPHRGLGVVHRVAHRPRLHEVIAALQAVVHAECHKAGIREVARLGDHDAVPLVAAHEVPAMDQQHGRRAICGSVGWVVHIQHQLLLSPLPPRVSHAIDDIPVHVHS